MQVTEQYTGFSKLKEFLFVLRTLGILNRLAQIGLEG